MPAAPDVTLRKKPRHGRAGACVRGYGHAKAATTLSTTTKTAKTA